MSQLAPRPTADTAKKSGILNGLLVGLMWVLEIIDVALQGALDWIGVHAWNVAMLWTLFTAPFAHLGFGHLAANSIPLLILGFLIALGGLRQWIYVTLAAVIGSGLFAFLLNPPGTVTIGASGVVFGYLTYLIIRGWFSRDWRQLLLGLLVLLIYGSMLWGVFPTMPGVSWQAHLGGAVAGVLVAWWLHSQDRRRHSKRIWNQFDPEP
ncbi:MAG TPA: rhomboid family intramembrane serine protease [Actinomycetaceae bacterium]|nr:rhomboid family intramembrane serine protease [Actinomycetaceae bacterium]